MARQGEHELESRAGASAVLPTYRFEMRFPLKSNASTLLVPNRATVQCGMIGGRLYPVPLVA
jgi:hypothetical protein